MPDRGRDRLTGLPAALAIILLAAAAIAVGGQGLRAPVTDDADLDIRRGRRDAALGTAAPQARSALPPTLTVRPATGRLVVGRADGVLQSVDLATGRVATATTVGARAPSQLAIAGDLLVVLADGRLSAGPVDLALPPVAVEGFRSTPVEAVRSDGDAVVVQTSVPGGLRSALGRVEPTDTGMRATRQTALAADGERLVDAGPAGALLEQADGSQGRLIGPDGALVTRVEGRPVALGPGQVVALRCADGVCELHAQQVDGAVPDGRASVVLPPGREVAARGRPAASPDGSHVVLTLLGGPGGGDAPQPAVVDLTSGDVEVLGVVLPQALAFDRYVWSSDSTLLFVPLGDQVVAFAAGDVDVLDLARGSVVTALAAG